MIKFTGKIISAPLAIIALIILVVIGTYLALELKQANTIQDISEPPGSNSPKENQPINKSKELPDEPNKVWVIYQPVQCLGNPWERDWIAKYKEGHKNDPDYNSNKASEAYLEMVKKQGGTIYTGNELIIEQFFKNQGLKVAKLERDSSGGSGEVCAACSCAGGAKVVIQTNPTDAETFISKYQFIKLDR